MQENPSPAAPPPKLRWYQYRLRTLLIVMTLLAVFFSWFGNRLRVAQLQRAAVAEIERDKSPDRYSFVSYEKKPKMPSWIERMAGEDFCYDVSAIILAKPGKKQLAALDDIPKFWNLGISDGKIGLDDFEHILRNRSLRRLVLSNTKFPFENPRQLESLEELFLDGDNLTDEQLRFIDGLTNLRQLHIDCNAITDRGLAKIKNHANLESFVLTSKSVTGSGLAFLKSAKHLKAVIFTDTPVTDEVMEYLRDSKELECFHIKRAGCITDKGLSCLKDHTKLTGIVIIQPDVPVTGKGLSYLEKCKSLEIVLLEKTTLTDDDLKILENCKQLQSLTIGKSNITGSGLEYLAKSSKMTHLSLSDSDFHDENIRMLNQFPLETLVVSGRNLTDASITQLKKKGINYLDLHKTAITDKSLPLLAQFPELKDLYLNDTSITFEGLKQLERTPKLKTLNIHNTAAAEHLKDNPEDMDVLQSLLRGVKIDGTKP